VYFLFKKEALIRLRNFIGMKDRLDDFYKHKLIFFKQKHLQ
jgi:hypothetical protein